MHGFTEFFADDFCTVYVFGDVYERICYLIKSDTCAMVRKGPNKTTSYWQIFVEHPETPRRCYGPST